MYCSEDTVNDTNITTATAAHSAIQNISESGSVLCSYTRCLFLPLYWII